MFSNGMATMAPSDMDLGWRGFTLEPELCFKRYPAELIVWTLGKDARTKFQIFLAGNESISPTK